MDEKRILTKFRELEFYLEKLEEIKPDSFDEYEKLVKDKLACERLLHLSVECVLDICNILISRLKSGMPADEDDVIEKLMKEKVVSKEMKGILIGMKGIRNILVHKYGEVKDELVFEVLSEKLEDFDKFKKEVLEFLNSKNKKR